MNFSHAVPVLLAPCAVLALGCTPPQWTPVLGEPRWVVPSTGIPLETAPLAANNNVSIALHDGLLFMAWRSAPSHFASADSRMYMAASADLGHNWSYEATWALGADVREPLLYVVNGTLHFQMFEAGTNPLAFEPLHTWRTRRDQAGQWQDLESWGEQGQVPWEVIVREDGAWLSSYLGEHYDLDAGPEALDVRLSQSTDGLNWEAVTVYTGGASEAAFQFDSEGALWAVLRNEDGDDSGFGSLLCTAPPGEATRWTCPTESSPERYDSPRMFLHEDEIWLLARRDIGGPYDQGRTDLSFENQRRTYLLDYSSRPKRTALYRIDRDNHEVVHVQDLPSAGDTAFPSVVQLDEHRFLVANYSSPFEDPDRTWLAGQVSDDGTGIYLIELNFESQ